MATAERRPIGLPDEVQRFPGGTLERITIGGSVVGRLTLQPGWRWSAHVQPGAGTEWCETPHSQFHLAGVLHVRQRDGVEFDARPGDVSVLPAGHDAWVVGDEPVVVFDWSGASGYGSGVDEAALQRRSNPRPR
ncbi:MAG: cupin domain-containing protein [Dehalococcoidia bacterium]